MYKNLFLYNGKIPLSFYLFASFHFILTCIALYTSIHLLPIPNISLLAYGFAVICLWKNIPVIFYKIIDIFSNKNKERLYLTIYLSATGIFFIYTTVISCSSTLLLFPLAWIHKIIAIVVYLVGIYFGLEFCFYSYFLIKNKPYKKLLFYIQKQENRKKLINDWLKRIDEFTKVHNLFSQSEKLIYLKKNPIKHNFYVDFWYYLFKNFIFLCLWLSIPTWIFIIIPFRTYSKFSNVPLFYQIGIIITIVFGIIWLIRIINDAGAKCQVNENGIIYHKFFQTFLVVWEQVKGVYLEGNCIHFVNIDSKIIHIKIEEFDNIKLFWKFIIEQLPLCIFFINLDGLNFLKKI